jgi:hypothetical protein
LRAVETRAKLRTPLIEVNSSACTPSRSTLAVSSGTISSSGA